MGRYLIIHNPISGRGRARRRMNDLVDELMDHGHHVEARCSESKEMAIRLAREIDPEAYDGLVSVGGDGTHNSIINGLQGKPVPLLPVPAGTENILSRGIGVSPVASELRRILEYNDVRQIDVGQANGQAFAVMAGVGFDATITGEVHARRSGPINRYYYFWPTLKNLATYRWPKLTVEVDGRVVAEDAAWALVGNMRLYADKLHVCLKAVPNDGLLDVCVFLRSGLLHLVGYAAAVRLGKHLELEDVVYRQGRQIVIRSDKPDTPFQVDGDAVGTAPATFDIRPGALHVFVPPVW